MCTICRSVRVKRHTSAASFHQRFCLYFDDKIWIKLTVVLKCLFHSSERASPDTVARPQRQTGCALQQGFLQLRSLRDELEQQRSSKMQDPLYFRAYESPELISNRKVQIPFYSMF